MTVVVEGPDDRGWVKRRCERSGCPKKTDWTNDEPERIGFRCLGWPHWSEPHLWLDFIWAAIAFRDLAPITVNPPEGHGPGSELSAMFLSLGVPRCTGCKISAQKMNSWGTQGCREHKEEIVVRLRERLREHGAAVRIRAAWRALCTGLAIRLNWLDPLPSLVDEAIRRSEASQVVRHVVG